MQLGEKCGVFGIYSNDATDVARLVYYGLWSLQHRGQENSGIVSSTGRKLYCHKGHGLVAQVYSESDIKKLRGNIAIGHNRYSTFGKTEIDHSQPVFKPMDHIALAHNGNLPVVNKLKKFFKSRGISAQGMNDSEMMHKMIEYYLVKGATLQGAVKQSFPYFTGAFSMLVMSRDKLVAVRDEYGIRPLCIGKINNSYIFASETCALYTVGAKYIREVEPGEAVVAGKDGLESIKLAKQNLKLDIFEFVYFARPDSVLLGKRIYEVRKNLGKKLAREIKIKADIVVPVPDSSIPAAIGYSQESRIPLEHALVKNRYIHRTFIKPSDKQRKIGVRMKLNVVADTISGKDIILIDDSIVRGNTSKWLVNVLREFGAKKVHFLVASPPVKYPDYYGIDTPKQKDLIAAQMNLAKQKKYIGADSLHYLSYKGMLESLGVPENMLCTSCFTGKYPISIGPNSRWIKKV